MTEFTPPQPSPTSYASSPARWVVTGIGGTMSGWLGGAGAEPFIRADAYGDRTTAENAIQATQHAAARAQDELEKAEQGQPRLTTLSPGELRDAISRNEATAATLKDIKAPMDTAHDHYLAGSAVTGLALAIGLRFAWRGAKKWFFDPKEQNGGSKP